MPQAKRLSVTAFVNGALAVIVLTASGAIARPRAEAAPKLSPASALSYSPTSLNQVVNLGHVFTQTVTLTATGSEAIDLTLNPFTTLLDRAYGVYATFSDPHFARFDRTNPGTLTDLGLFTNGSPGGDFVGHDFSKVYAIANVDPYDPTDDVLVTIATSNGTVLPIGPLGDPAGFESFGAMSYDPVTDKLYALSSYVDFFGTGGNTLYTVDLTTGQATALGPIVSPFSREIGSMAFDDAGHLYAHDVYNQELVQINLDPLSFAAIGVLDVFSEFNTGMDWDSISQQMYLSLWRSAEGGELRTIDLATAQTTLVGPSGGTPAETAFTWIAFASAPAPWLTVEPPQVSVPANGTATVDLVLDTRSLYQPGAYTGQVGFNGVFSNSVAALPITMAVNCPACGRLVGNFTDAWSSAPLQARLHIESGAGMDIHLTSDNHYSATVPVGTYTLTASAPGYHAATQVVTATTGHTTITHIALLPQASLLEVDSTPLEVNATLGEVVTRTLTVSNTGTIPLSLTVRMDNLDVPVAVRQATLSALSRTEVTSPEAVLAIQAYGVNHSVEGVGGELAWFDLSDPTTLAASGVYHDHGSLIGGDFFGNDFARLYGFEESRLMALDTASGAKTYVGALPLISPYTSHDSMAYDPVTDAMYVLYKYDCNAPPATLYQVNLETAVVTALGNLADDFDCMGDIAFDDTGRLYAVDIDNNTLVTIDPATAATTVIGPLGFDLPVFEHGLAWDSATNQMYLTAVDPTGFPFIQKFYQVDVFTGRATYLSDIGTVTPGAGLASLAGLAIQSEAQPWADLPVNTITIPPGGSTTFDVAFDTRNLYRIGDYVSDLTFSGTFINPAPTVPVALHLTCPTCGVLTGTITAAGTATALPAKLGLTNGDGVDLALFNKTSYSLTVLPGTYTVTAASPGYVGDSATVSVTANGVATADFALIKAVAVISVSPTAITATLLAGQSVTHTFSIDNLGLADFDFVMRDEDLGAISASPTLTACGPADSFGYACIDSNSPGGPAYHWVDISISGQSLALDGANDYYGMLQLPFAFNYYGNAYSALAISSYGQVYFEDRLADPSFAGNQPIPSTIEADGVQTFIAPYWDSLNYDAWNNPQTYYEVQGVAPHRRVVIQWNNLTANWENPITFQVILFEDSGNILMQYQALNGDTGESASIGIQGNETTGLEYSYNAATLSDNLAICYVPPGSTNPACDLEPREAEWLTESVASGTIAAHASLTVTVVLDATHLSAGLYQAEIYFGGTDNAPYVLPVTLQVSQRTYLPVLVR